MPLDAKYINKNGPQNSEGRQVGTQSVYSIDTIPFVNFQGLAFLHSTAAVKDGIAWVAIYCFTNFTLLAKPVPRTVMIYKPGDKLAVSSS